MARTKRLTKTTGSTPRVILYTRVSTSEQADSGAGLGAQRSALHQAAGQRGWQVVAELEDAGVSAKTMDRPALIEALRMVEAGEAGTIAVSKLDRLSRSLLDFATLMERSQRKGWSIVALDLGLDTTTPAGELMASILATFSQYERRLIGARTTDALRIKKAEGVILGRPRTLPADVAERIATMRAEGLSLAAIARSLNAEGVPTAQGGARWYPSTVAAVLSYAAA